MTIMGVLLHWSQANSFELVLRQNHWRPQEDQDRGESSGSMAPSPKTYKLTSFTTIVYNWENSIRDVSQFCRPLFSHSSVVRYASSLLQ